MGDELWSRSASELAAMIRAGEVKSREVVEAHLARIDAVNGALNAVTVTLADTALGAADEADAAVASGGELGPLHGVPFTIKENLDVAGSATTQGVPAMAEAVPPVDAVVVERMKAAGAIALARTNLPEMGLRISTNNPLRGLTRNPWHPELTAGGSSGGEAAALATGMTPIGLGNDLGGSLRNPAYCCGVTSLKPTSPGRIPLTSSLPPLDPPIGIQLMATDGPMARRVADLRVGLQVLAGWHPRDPRSVTAPLEAPDAPRRAALVTQIEGAQLDPAVVAAVRKAGDALRDAGYEVTEAQPPELARVHEIWARVLSPDVALMLGELTPIMSEGALGILHGLLERYPPDEVPAAFVFAERARLGRAWSEFLAELPVIVSPVWSGPPFAHDADLDAEAGRDLTLDLLRPITAGNLLGIPSVAVPVGVEGGLPRGVQVYAERWCEQRCLDAAEAIERELGCVTPIDPVT
jgi:amidase